MALHYPLTKDALCKVWLKVVHRSGKKYEMLIIWNAFSLIYSPGKWPFIWININSDHPRMFCVKFGRNWPSRSGEEDFLMLITNFCNSFFSNLGMGHAFIWTNLKLHHSRMHASCQVLLKLAQWFLKRWIYEKFTIKQTDRRWTTDDQKSSLELSTVSYR